MAYLVHSSPNDRDNLDYKLEGGNPRLTMEGLKRPDGRPLKDAELATFIFLSLPVPPQLMPAVPTRIVVKPARGGFIPDFGSPTLPIGARIVSERFVSLVERLEPGAHQFIPINECVDQRGEPLGLSLYLMNVLTRLDAIDVEHSNAEWETTRFADGTEMTTLSIGFPFQARAPAGGHQRASSVARRKERSVGILFHVREAARRNAGSATFCAVASQV
jgi:hypothetical protein